MSNITVFSVEQSAVVTYFDKKGTCHGITAHGALFKGGDALKSLKDAALDSAFKMAENGRYRASCDVLGAAFPATLKAAESFMSTAPWGSKTNFTAFVSAVLRLVPKAGKDFSAKQRSARALAVELDTFLSPVVEQSPVAAA